MSNLPAHVAYRRPANRQAALVADVRPVVVLRVRMHHGPALRAVLAVFGLALTVALFAGLLASVVVTP